MLTSVYNAHNNNNKNKNNDKSDWYSTALLISYAKNWKPGGTQTHISCNMGECLNLLDHWVQSLWDTGLSLTWFQFFSLKLYRCWEKQYIYIYIYIYIFIYHNITICEIQLFTQIMFLSIMSFIHVRPWDGASGMLQLAIVCWEHWLGMNGPNGLVG